MPIGYLGWSMLYGQRADSDPWRATGLEWQTSSPPPENNFDAQPEVVCEAYCYHEESEAPDARAQTAEASSHRPQAVREAGQRI
jgi:cytochrome c oxidase subunit 1